MQMGFLWFYLLGVYQYVCIRNRCFTLIYAVTTIAIALVLVQAAKDAFHIISKQLNLEKKKKQKNLQLLLSIETFRFVLQTALFRLRRCIQTVIGQRTSVHTAIGFSCIGMHAYRCIQSQDRGQVYIILQVSLTKDYTIHCQQSAFTFVRTLGACVARQPAVLQKKRRHRRPAINADSLYHKRQAWVLLDFVFVQSD